MNKPFNAYNEKPIQKGFGVDGVTPIPDLVDLGTVVNGKTILWASFNLGASNEYEYGDYYAWGETEPYYSNLKPLAWKAGKEQGYEKTSYIWSNGMYEYYKLSNILPSHDVAYEKLGGNWRIPTIDEIRALQAIEAKASKDNSDYIWEKWALARDINGNEVKDEWGNAIHGIRITRRSTKASLFLPAAGTCRGAVIGNKAGVEGYYWSSSLDLEYPNTAPCLFFIPDGSICGCVSPPRFFGLPVRPVSE